MAYFFKVIAQYFEEVAKLDIKTFDRVLDIGISLASQTNHNKLLWAILSAAREITNADGGTLYLFEDDLLHFKMVQNASMSVFMGENGEPPKWEPLAYVPENICAFAVINQRSVNIPDVYCSKIFDFSGSKRFDAANSYRTKSMLTVPLKNNENKVIGVIQLINAQDTQGNIISFDVEIERVINALCCQAAISLTNMQYTTEINDLFYSFIEVMTTAIEERTPYNANHTKNIVKYAKRLVGYLNANINGISFDSARLEEFVMSAWFHDIGKITVPLEIMDKESRLSNQIDIVLERFNAIYLSEHIRFLKGEITQEEWNSFKEYFDSSKALIISANTVGFLPPEKIELIRKFGQNTYIDLNGEVKPYLTDHELVKMSIAKGTLTDEEREVMNNHVVMTSNLLSKIKFNKRFKNAPVWAGMHHECINGTGYPYKLKDDEIPFEARALSILDIYDALTASDRPYKPAMPVEKALSILDSMVNEGKLDGAILQFIKEARIWED